MFEEIRDPSARVRALCQYGCQVDVDVNIPPKRYFRSGQQMVHMTNSYLDDGDLESAFILCSKYTTLFVEKLPKHPDYKSSTVKDKELTKKRLTKMFSLAELLKEKLREKYTKHEVKRKAEEKAREEQKAAEEAERLRLEEARLKVQEIAEHDKNKQWKTQEEDMLLEQQRMLEFLKIKEQKRLEDEQHIRLSGVSISTTIPITPPPDYEQTYRDQLSEPQIPSRDLKPSVPAVDRSKKPSHFTVTGVPTLNKYNLRDVLVPSAVTDKFLSIASPNTRQNIETCGILCGHLRNNAFTISALLIPKQSGTSDTCTTESEEDIFNYQDSKNLITLGWIHTHPSQTAFLSSVDLHTHCSYQQLLPEAIAIVCAPKYHETGYFYLTPHHGLGLISACRHQGFHDHPNHPPLFEHAEHMKILPAGALDVVDLR
ncbi:hypothetical protein LSH36_142g05051 [Paralvinella palmiformis]|uniref:MPN domain-containing protein n=1 Tax=Paralvinella palmiformis TaxID=53620 RepID=A0AAD9JWA0_9ANNE|nr:hypothetical protein LSH36_142g05051 [Paralvinella palmiformis]